MRGQRRELPTLGSCGRELLPGLHGGQDGEAGLCRSSAQPWPSDWLSVSSSTLLCGSGTIPASKENIDFSCVLQKKTISRKSGITKFAGVKKSKMQGYEVTVVKGYITCTRASVRLIRIARSSRMKTSG